MKRIILLLFIIIQYSLFNIQLLAQVWDTVPGRIGHSGACIYDLYTYNNKLYVGGFFLYVGTETINNIAIWDGINWYNPGGGTGDDVTVYCIKDYNNEIYIGGDFASVGGGSINIKNQMARWDGANWHAVGTGYIDPYATAEICDMEVFNGELYVIGSIYQLEVPAGQTEGIKVWNLAKWDGSNWHNVWNYGEELTYAKFNNALAIYNGELIVGGRLTLTTPEGTAHNIASWNGSQWKPLGDGISDLVNDMVVDTINNFLYVGGAFYYAGGILVNFLAKWDGYKWSEVGDWINILHTPTSLIIYHNQLYAGTFSNSCPGGDHAIYRLNGISWDTLGEGIKCKVEALEVYHDTLFVGGGFDTAGIIPARKIAKWYSPADTSCNYIQPLIHTMLPNTNTIRDTFYMNTDDSVQVQFYNNNAYVNSWQWDFGDGETDTIQKPLHTYYNPGIYTIGLTILHNHNLCAKICTLTVDKTITILDNTGIKDFNAGNLNFKLYPNPSDNSFTIEAYIAADDKGIIKIYGLKGQLLKKLVLKKGSNKTMVHTLGWRKGIYVCNLVINGKVVKSEKMVLVR